MYLITNGRLITRDPQGCGYYPQGAVAFDGTTITDVGTEAELRARYPKARILDAQGGASRAQCAAILMRYLEG